MKWMDASGIGVKNYYRELQVPANASQQDVKNAFRRASKYFHPDRVPAEQVAAKKWATGKFQGLGEAFEVLTDPLMRERYDTDHFGSRDNAQFVRSATWRDLSTDLRVRHLVFHLDLLKKGFRFDVLADFITEGHKVSSGLYLPAVDLVTNGLLAEGMGFDFEFWIKIANATKWELDTHNILDRMYRALEERIKDWLPVSHYVLFVMALDDQYPEGMRAKAKEALASEGKWATKCLEAANH